MRREVWISKKKITNIEKRLADLENTVQSQQERLKKLKLDRIAIYYSTKTQLNGERK